MPIAYRRSARRENESVTLIKHKKDAIGILFYVLETIKTVCFRLPSYHSISKTMLFSIADTAGDQESNRS